MTKQVDIRARLDAIKARADAATEGPWYGAAGNHYVYGVTPGDEVGRFNRPADARFAQRARTEHPAMAAALTAVLDLLDEISDEDEITTQADGVHVPVYLVRAAITDALGGDRG